MALDARGELDSLLEKHARNGSDRPVGGDNTNDQADKENAVSENHRDVFGRMR